MPREIKEIKVNILILSSCRIQALFLFVLHLPEIRKIRKNSPITIFKMNEKIFIVNMY